MKEYTVWVGGVEVNDYYVDLSEAEAIQASYENEGYDDVSIEYVSKAEQEARYKAMIG